MSKKFDIPAIHDKDLRKILKEFGFENALDNNLLKCSKCRNLITWETISALRVVGDTLDIYCNDPDCLEFATNK